MKKMTVKRAYEYGMDYAKNGPNEVNSNFAIFATFEKTKAWERGKKAGERLNKTEV
jgi:hypothetical protein